jgi:hypothetical protein
VEDTDEGCVDGRRNTSASSSSAHCTSIFLDLSRPVSASHRCGLECELSCVGDNRAGGDRRRLGERRTVSDARVAATLGVMGVEFPTMGVPFWEPPLPVARCTLRTVEGVAGERPPTPCGARGVVLAPLSMLTCLARGVVS